MSKLRELLGKWACERGPHKLTYALLKGLVDELEAQRPPEVDARIAKLTAERDRTTIATLTAERNSWERQCRIAERGLAEAKAEMDRLQEERDYAEKEAACKTNVEDSLRRTLAKAQAEIARLRKERDSAEHKLEALGAIDERILTDAELGRLVRGMPWGTKLSVHGYDLSNLHYMAFRWHKELDGDVLVKDCADPAEALRSIQANE